MPLRVSCLGPVPRLPCLGGGAARFHFLLPGSGLRAPRGVGAGVGTRHPPHRACSCALALRAVGAARGGPGGAPFALVWGVRGRAFSHPRPLVLSGMRPGPTAHWLWLRGLRARGPVTNPTACALASWLCALWGRHEGARRGRLLPGRPNLGALPPSTARPLGRAAGAHYPVAVGVGGAGVGTRHPPHSERFCELALCAVGGGTRAPGGGASCLGVGRPGTGALPLPTTCPFRHVAGAHYPLAVAAGGAGVRTRHQPHSAPLASWLCALWGRHKGARGGGASCLGVKASGDWRSPTPKPLVLSGVQLGTTTHWLWVRRCGRGDLSPTRQRALLRAGFARCGGNMRVPGGGTSCLGVGRPGSGALPPHTTRPFGPAAGAHYPLAVGAGDAGVGTRHQPHPARNCALALRAVGAAGGRPGGAPLVLVWGVRGRAFSHPRLLVLSGVRQGPTTHWLWLRGLRAWGPVSNPITRALASWLSALWGRESAALGRGWCRRAQGRQDRGGRHARSRPERCFWGQNQIHGHQRRRERQQRKQDPC